MCSHTSQEAFNCENYRLPPGIACDLIDLYSHGPNKVNDVTSTPPLGEFLATGD